LPPETHVNHLLELLGKGLGSDLGELLKRYYWSPQDRRAEELRSACRAHPEVAELHFQLGLACLSDALVDEAIVHLSRFCQQKPRDVEGNLALAAACADGGRTEKALAHLAAAREVGADLAAVEFAMGFCCERVERAQDAAEHYRKTIAAEGHFMPARERLAAVALLLGRTDEAIEQYDAMRQAEPQEPWIRATLARLLHHAGRHERAAEEFESAIVLEPENWALVDDEVESLVAEGRTPEAMDRLKMLIEQQGPFPDLYVRLADLCSERGDDDAALSNYRAALDMQPNYLEATVKLGTHHLVFGRWEEAAEAFHQAMELNDRLMANYVGMGVAQEAAGRHIEAMNSFDLAAAVEPNSTLLLTEMARLQLKATLADSVAESFGGEGNTPIALMELQNGQLLQKQLVRHGEQIERHPRHADLRYRYGVLLRSEGRLAQAAQQFDHAVRLSGTYLQAAVRLGITQQEMGQVKAATETFRRALEVDPCQIEWHYRLGLMYIDRARFEQAVRDMTQRGDDEEEIRARLALSLQHMGLMDRAAASWRSLCRMHAGA
jgi:tetratricopeptide (TPR) repeat protein